MGAIQELHIRGAQQSTHAAPPPAPPAFKLRHWKRWVLSFVPIPIEGAQQSTHAAPPPSPPAFKLRHWKRWVMVALMSFLVLAGQTVATLLGRFYYDEGGNSKWMATLVQSAGSPLLLLVLFLFPSSCTPTTNPSVPKLIFIYISLGLLIAGDNLMYSYGLLYVPVSTYSLVCASQLAFNAIFSYFLNSDKFTALIFNSIALLTFSAALLGVRAGSDTPADASRGKYVLGFILTLAASAAFSLILSLMQLTFEKVLKRVNFRVVLEMQFCTNFIAACASTFGLLASGEWRSLTGEMESFGKGKVAYVMALVWTAISWQVASVGLVGLIFEVSSLFANVIGTFALPLVPIFAVVWFHDEMDGVKVMAMLIAIWGFLSYLYQHYLDDCNAKKMATDEAIEVSAVSAC